MSDAFPLIRKQIQLLKKIYYEEFMESYKNSIYNPWKKIFNDLLNFKNKYNVLPKYNSDEPYNLSMKFGLNPAERSRVSVTDEPEGLNPWANL